MEFDVLIAGGGPAGLSAAFTAAKSGTRVAVFEKSKEIGYPIHTSGGSWIDELRKLDIPEKFMHPIHEGVFISPNERAVFKYQQPRSCILDVRGLYQYLAELASVAGAQIFVNSTVLTPIFERDKIAGLKVRRLGREEIFRAPLLIDASGAMGVLARKTGLTKGFTRMGLGAEYDVVAPNWPPYRVAFLFGSQAAPSGYGWVFPHENNRVRVGVGIIHPDTSDDPKQFLQRIMSDSKIFDGDLSQVSEIEYHSGVIPSEPYLEKTAADGLMVVGDAGGLISILLGEGIRFAIDIGRMAGEISGEAVRKKRFDYHFLQKFESVWQKKYKKIFKMGSFMNKRLGQYSDRKWDERIKELSKLAPEFIPILLKGELSSANLFKMAKSHPAFFKKAITSGLKTIFKNT